MPCRHTPAESIQFISDALHLRPDRLLRMSSKKQTGKPYAVRRHDGRLCAQKQPKVAFLKQQPQA